VLGLDEVRGGDYEAAREQFKFSATGLYNGLAIDLVTAWTYAGEGDLVAAEAVLKKMNGLGLGGILRPYHLGLMHERQGNLKEAEENYLAANKASQGASLRITQAYGHLLERQARGPEALAHYQKFLELAPGHPTIVAALSRLRKGEVPEMFISSITDGAAESVFSVAGMLSGERTIDLPIIYLRIALDLRPDLVDAKLLLGELYQQNGQWVQSAKTFASIPSSSPFAIDAAIQIAANLNRLERTDDAIDVLRGFLDKRPGEIDVLVALGDLLRVQQKFEEAVAVYNEAFEVIAASKDPAGADWFLHYARGVSLQETGDWPAAERDLLHALDLAPEQPLILNHLGYSWIERRYRVDDALALVQKAVDLSPNNGFIIDSLGWAYYRLEDYDQAVRHLERAVELEPDDPTLHDHLGDAYWMKGRFVEAGFEWSHALGLSPAKEQAVVIEKKLAARSTERSSLE